MEEQSGKVCLFLKQQLYPWIMIGYDYKYDTVRIMHFWTVEPGLIVNPLNPKAPA